MNFVFVCPMYNAINTLPRMLHSICGQSNTNWKLILIDDVSDPHQKLMSQTIVSTFKMLDKSYHDKIQVVWNDTKKWEVANVLHGISLCNDDDIICRIDADDFLCELDALSMIESAYNETNCDCLWTAHRWECSDRNISGPMANNVNPYTSPWVSSHLKTFRKKLMNGIPYENFLNQNGDLVRRAGDQCVMLPVLYRAKSRIYLPRVMYHYTIDEQGGAVYQTEDAKFQKREADFIRARGIVMSGEAWETKI